MRRFFSFILLSLAVLLPGCGGGGGPSGGTQPEEWYEFQGFMYSASRNIFTIFGREVANVYQIRSSPDGKRAIFSVVRPGMQPDLYVASENDPDARRVTYDEGIEFDPAINDSGDFAYALHDNSVAISRVFVNGEELALPAGLYKNLALHNDILAMHQASHYDETDWLVVYDISTRSVSRTPLGIAPDFIAFQSVTTIILEGLSNANHENEVLVYDIEANAFSYLKRSGGADICYLDDYRYGETAGYVCFPPGQVRERLAFLGLRHLRRHDPAGALACSNNYLGRLSWNVSYRLQGLLALHESGAEVDYPVAVMIRNIADCLVAGVESDGEGPGWPTKKYSIDGTEKLYLLVDDAMILYPLLKAANDNLVGETAKSAIISLAEGVYDRHEADYDPAAGSYHFRKGISYWADGLWLPYNMQNVFGLALTELHEATGKEKYKTRALELAGRFRSGWVLPGDGRSLWHYWPGEFYAGWSVEDGLSVNTPSRAPSTDGLYEDVSHAGLNVEFVRRIHSSFVESPFSADDVRSLGDTLRGFRYGETYSRFIGGDVDYQPASRRHIPWYGWTATGDDLLTEDVSQGIPFVYPLFEGDHAMTYFMALRDETIP